MRVWRVRVQYIGERPPRKLGKPYRPVKTQMVCLVEAEDSSAAMAAGARYIEGEAQVSVRWQEFTAMEAASTSLPLLVDTL